MVCSYLGSLSAEGSPILQFRKSTSATDVLLQLDHSSDLRNSTRSDLSDLNLQVVDPDPDNDGSAVLYRIDLPSAGHCFWKFAGTLVAP